MVNFFIVQYCIFILLLLLDLSLLILSVCKGAFILHNMSMEVCKGESISTIILPLLYVNVVGVTGPGCTLQFPCTQQQLYSSSTV